MNISYNEKRRYFDYHVLEYPDYIVVIEENYETKEYGSWLTTEKSGIMMYMFGIPFEGDYMVKGSEDEMAQYEQFLWLVEKNLDTYIEIYEEDYNV